jgi:hypothetical protein
MVVIDVLDGQAAVPPASENQMYAAGVSACATSTPLVVTGVGAVVTGG